MSNQHGDATPGLGPMLDRRRHANNNSNVSIMADGGNAVDHLHLQWDGDGKFRVFADDDRIMRRPLPCSIKDGHVALVASQQQQQDTPQRQQQLQDGTANNTSSSPGMEAWRRYMHFAVPVNEHSPAEAPFAIDASPDTLRRSEGSGGIGMTAAENRRRYHQQDSPYQQHDERRQRMLKNEEVLPPLSAVYHRPSSDDGSYGGSGGGGGFANAAATASRAVSHGVLAHPLATSAYHNHTNNVYDDSVAVFRPLYSKVAPAPYSSDSRSGAGGFQLGVSNGKNSLPLESQTKEAQALAQMREVPNPHAPHFGFGTMGGGGDLLHNSNSTRGVPEYYALREQQQRHQQRSASQATTSAFSNSGGGQHPAVSAHANSGGSHHVNNEPTAIRGSYNNPISQFVDERGPQQRY